jgi:hypothetical protein
MEILKLYWRDFFWLVVVVAMGLDWWKASAALRHKQASLNSIQARLTARLQHFKYAEIHGLYEDVRRLKIENRQLQDDKQELIHRLVAE